MLINEFLGTFYLERFQPKMATTQTIDIICDTFWRWNYKLLKLNLTYRTPLHWIGSINRQGNNTVEKSRFQPFKIWIVKLHAFLTFHTSAPNWLKFSVSMSAGLIHSKKEPVGRFKNSFETLPLSKSIALLRSVMTFHKYLSDQSSRFFDDLLLAEHW